MTALRAIIHLDLDPQAAEVAAKLRRKGLTGTSVKLKIRWPDFTTPTRHGFTNTGERRLVLLLGIAPAPGK